MKRFCELVVSALAVALLFGCATQVWKKEALLTKAGFRAFTAKTPEQLALLKNLPPDKISPVTVKRRTYFVFPDPKNNRVYAGNQAELTAYQRIRAKRKLTAEQVETKRIEDYTDFGRWGAIDYGWYSF